jgi:predicted ABC-type ATPase
MRSEDGLPTAPFREKTRLAERRTPLSLMNRPIAVLIAGPNGAGKTTFARQVIPLLHPDVPFLNADEIQRESPQFAQPLAAAREFLHRLGAAERSAHSFVIETTLASRSFLSRFRRWGQLGFRTELHFIELPSADFAVERVRARVAAGGHHIPESDIRRRFARGKRLFFEVYNLVPDVSYHWFSNSNDLSLVSKRP